MKAVGLKVLKNRLSEYVRLAAAGETVLVTDRDRVVAELTPPRTDRPATPADAMLADLVEQGLLTLPKRRSDQPIPRHRIMTLDELVAQLAEDRADR